MHYVDDLAYKYPYKTVLFVTQLMAKKFLKLTQKRKLPQNLRFISYRYFLEKVRGMKYIAVIDDLDCWLASNFNVVGYSNTIGE